MAEYLNVSQAARELGVSRCTLHCVLRQGLIRRTTIYRRKLIPRYELERYLRSRRETQRGGGQ